MQTVLRFVLLWGEIHGAGQQTIAIQMSLEGDRRITRYGVRVFCIYTDDDNYFAFIQRLELHRNLALKRWDS